MGQNFGYTQVAASFSATKTKGCSPLTNVKFSDNSTGNITSRTWFLGLGGSPIVGNNTEVYATYTTSGYYTIKLIVSDGIKTDTLTRKDYIRVYESPIPKYSSNVTGGCAPLTVNFSNLSTEGDTVITTAQWDFDDGGFSTSLTNVSHSYIGTGNFDVTLTITDFFGCKNSVVIEDYIKISKPPIASFSSTLPPVSCDTPLTVIFNNASTGSGSLNYKWYFGDSTTSSLSNPTRTYTKTGSFTVSLVAKDPGGCSDSISKKSFVSIGRPSAAFTTPKDTFCVESPVKFDNKSSAVSYSWNLDGIITSDISPEKSFSTKGKKIIQLIAYGPSGACSDTIRDSIFIEKVTADFVVNSSYGCKIPFKATYINTSTSQTGVKTWNWDFGDTLSGMSNTSTGKNPVHTYNQIGNYTTTLTAISNHGCTDTKVVTDFIKVFDFSANFTSDVTKGCIPLTVNFTDLTVPTDSIASWNWSFGDPTSGSANSSTLKNPQHIFNNDGSFFVKLTVTDLSGCTHSTTILLNSGSKPVVDFKVDTVLSCGSDPLKFTDLTIPKAPKSDEWIWSFGDGGVSASSSPVYTYVDTGYMDVQLIVGYNGCYDTLKKDSMLYILGPIANASTSFSCDSTFNYCFDGSTIIDANRWEWDFRDGSIDSNTITTCHTYANTGDRLVKLTTINDLNGCRDSIYMPISVRNIEANFVTTPTFGCSPLIVCYDAKSSKDAVNYFWKYYAGVGGFAQAGVTDCYNYTQPRGLDTIGFVAMDINGCTDTTYRVIQLYRPQSAFFADTLYGCAPISVMFTDTSKSDTTIVGWKWDFGDGTTSVLQNPSHSYSTIGDKTVTLVTTDKLGCVDTLSKSAYIAPYKPVPDFSLPNLTLCQGTTVKLLNLTSNKSGNPVSYFWNFGDGITSTEFQPIHTFNDTGIFTFSLYAKDTVLGCDSVKIFPNFMKIQAYPKVSFSADPTYVGCYPDFIQFTDSTVSNYLKSWTWNFGDGSSSILQSPGHQYNFRGFYDVSLIASTTYGCKDTLVKKAYIEIDGPYAAFSTNPDTVCIGEPISFSVDTLWNVQDYDWDYGDGTITPFATSPVEHSYDQIGILFPKLIYRSPVPGCEQVYIDTVFIHQVKADFTVSDSIGCEKSLNINFTNTSVNGNVYQWSFGDGGKATSKNSVYQYSKAGIFDASLIISDNATGCVDTANKEVIVYPVPELSVSPDTLICRGQSVNLFANGPVKSLYKWTPATTVNNDTISNPIAKPSQTTNYTIIITDTNNCKTPKTIAVTVQQEAIVGISSDTVIIIGEYVQLESTSQIANVTYSWTPNTGLDCTICQNPIAQPLENTVYTLEVADDNDCFVTSTDVRINVRKEFSVEVPNTFSPNGDGVNDKIFVKGWGVKELLEYKIFNRWGQLVFSTNDINEGWDGFYEGKIQNIDTYAVTATVLTYLEEQKSYKGFISLVR